jgi:hypothetical protein
LSWTADGSLLVTGQFSMPTPFDLDFRTKTRIDTPFAVFKVDPQTMKIVDKVIHHDGKNGFGGGTVAAEIRNEIWVGTSRGSMIGCFAKGDV